MNLRCWELRPGVDESYLRSSTELVPHVVHTSALARGEVVHAGAVKLKSVMSRSSKQYL